MGKFAFKYAIIICINLFAFLFLGHILDTIFAGEGTYTIIMLIISIIPLMLIAASLAKKTLQDLDNIDKDNK